jgi:hypothetical protein
MDLDLIPPTVVAVVLILTCGGVAILRPLAKKGGELMEAIAREKREPPRPRSLDDHRIVELLEAINHRLEKVEERQDFTDSLLTRPRADKTLPPSPS